MIRQESALLFQTPFEESQYQIVVRFQECVQLVLTIVIRLGRFRRGNVPQDYETLVLALVNKMRRPYCLLCGNSSAYLAVSAQVEPCYSNIAQTQLKVR